MRKCNVEYNKKRGATSAEHAEQVANVTADKSWRIPVMPWLGDIFQRFGTFRTPLNTKDARYSTAYSGPTTRSTEVFA